MPHNKPLSTISVAEFKDKISNQLSSLPDDHLIYFGNGDLDFCKIKTGNAEGTAHQIEFNQTYNVYNLDGYID
ncbi:hypothetical protein [Citrobacter braakii]|uniref:hypothetical protein n=1 Tax=Citrobacter braakii TaxID=57706 RepID=UPI00351CB912